ncbi:MAG: hypothetical protein Unbinned200contig1002_38 [Prokaryotic dsDNA virus sp.]|jgi:hypothetical protein|nr:hypothetical protein [Flavobacteriaceae bacterium]QDP68337.1 MAG: hypothetical protein Unbinned200contig1002_38 [Prokaryotic dsDNA virus sp.]|tara:strand:- start:37484 stop:37834 length:351 start_codon:yes stop_codon:yes gene_type:complete
MLGKRVQVYKNLHKNCWSIRLKKTQRVIAHLDEVFLVNAKFIVQQGGRRRVLNTKTKNVHAFIEGEIVSNLTGSEYSGRATYNPYKFASFVDTETKESLDRAFVVRLKDNIVNYLK